MFCYYQVCVCVFVGVLNDMFDAFMSTVEPVAYLNTKKRQFLLEKNKQTLGGGGIC